MQDQEYRTLIRSLNRDQKEIFYRVLNKAKTTDDQQYIFISGGAGVGKTRVTKSIYQSLWRIFNTSTEIQPEKTAILLTAPTAKAAFLIKGLTIDSAFCVPVNQKLSSTMLPAAKLNTFRCKYSNLKWLIIDEVSMCGTNLLNYINMRLQEIMGTSKHFGGVNVLAIGDLYQLKPVKDRSVFLSSNEDYGYLAPNVWQENFNMYELTKIMRQIDDIPFSEALNRLREDIHTLSDIELLRSREVKDSNYPLHVVHMMFWNKDVDTHNNSIYQATNTAKAENEATDIIIGDVTFEVAEQIKAKAPTKAGDSMGLAKYFKTKVSLKNDMTVNLDVEDGLVNGAVCVTKPIDYSPATGKPHTIWVQFDDQEIGTKLRRECRHMYTSEIDKQWTPVRPISREFQVGRYRNAKLRRTQFPLQLSCAKTIHKSQGQTYTEAALKLPDQRKTHIHYVAFSRVTSLNNLYILNEFDPTLVTVCPHVKQEMKRLRTTGRLQLCFRPLYTFDKKYFKILFHNSQSLRLHITDVCADDNFTSSDISLFVETKLCHTDKDTSVTIPNFHLFRNDFSYNRTAYGSAVYTHQSMTTTISRENFGRIEITILRVQSPVPLLQIVSVYIRPNEPIQDIQKTLGNLIMKLQPTVPIIILGDFNINSDEHSAKYTIISKVMRKLNCKQVIKDYTTDARTTIDLIFTNISQDKYIIWVLESCFSYHKPIYICVAKQATLFSA